MIVGEGNASLSGGEKQRILNLIIKKEVSVKSYCMRFYPKRNLQGSPFVRLRFLLNSSPELLIYQTSRWLYFALL